MDLKRFFSDNKIIGNKIILTGEEFYHAVKVTRHKKGYKIIVCDNADIDYYATITEIGKDFLEAEIDNVIKNIAESAKNITLYIGINKDIDAVVQKAVELGVKRIAPFTSKHGNENVVNYKRLEKIILESSKQCGRSYLAKIDEIMTFQEAVYDAKDSNLLFFYEAEEQIKMSDINLNEDKDIAIFIGSEGGFSMEEVALAQQNNAKILTMGKRILRVSTAVVAALTLCMEKLGEM